MTIRDGNAGTNDGGGIRHSGGALTLNGVAVKNNKANSGGGIDSNGDLTLIDTRVTDNMATGDGGGIRSGGGQVKITRGVVSKNSAGGDGGGIHDASDLNMANSTVSNNTATGDGGGLFSSGGWTIKDSKLESNKAVDGAAINDQRDGGSLIDSVLQNNMASGNGGGVFAAGNVLKIIRSLLARNTATGTGGGVHRTADGPSCSMTNSTLSANIAANGGGLFQVDRSTELYNVTIAFNTPNGIAKTGGAVELHNSIVGNNVGADCVGGVTAGNHNLDSDATCVGAVPQGNDRTAPNPGIDHDLSGTGVHALMAGSPAINSANIRGCLGDQNVLLTLDQEKQERPQNARCDRGADETAFVIIQPIDAPNNGELPQRRPSLPGRIPPLLQRLNTDQLMDVQIDPLATVSNQLLTVTRGIVPQQTRLNVCRHNTNEAFACREGEVNVRNLEAGMVQNLEVQVFEIRPDTLFPARLGVGDITWDVLTPREAIEDIQDHIEVLILDDDIDSTFGSQLLDDLDEVIKQLDKGDTTTAIILIDDIEDDVNMGIREGDIGQDDGDWIRNMIGAVGDILSE